MGKEALSPPKIKWLVEPTYDDDGVQRSSGLDQFGREHPDPCPVAPPIGTSVSNSDPTYAAIKRILVEQASQFAGAVSAEGFETEAEANDFECSEDLFPPGQEPWEDVFEFPVPPPTGGVAGNGAPTSQVSAVQGENRGPEDPTSPPASKSPSEPVTAAGEGKVK